MPSHPSGPTTVPDVSGTDGFPPRGQLWEGASSWGREACPKQQRIWRQLQTGSFADCCVPSQGWAQHPTVWASPTRGDTTELGCQPTPFTGGRQAPRLPRAKKAWPRPRLTGSAVLPHPHPRPPPCTWASWVRVCEAGPRVPGSQCRCQGKGGAQHRLGADGRPGNQAGCGRVCRWVLEGV